MVNYQNGKIYRLISASGKQYIGSTTVLLTKRKYDHKKKYELYKGGHITNKCSSVLLFEEGEVDIVLIENFPCDSKEELEKRERYWVDNISGVCVNRNKPRLLEGERNQRMRQYYQDHREEKQAYDKKYRQENKAHRSALSLALYHRKKNIINQKRSEKIKCECGNEVARSSLACHRKTKVHLNNLSGNK